MDLEIDIFLYISFGLISYVIILLISKKLGLWRKIQCEGYTNCCPHCNEPVERIKRNQADYITNYLTFQIFGFKRYKCLHCGWEGRRWEQPFSGKF